MVTCLQEGAVSKAEKYLQAAGIHKYEPRILDRLLELHPQSPLPSLPPTDSLTAEITCSEDEVRQAIITFPAGSAPGLSQLRPSHLKEGLGCGNSMVQEAFLEALTEFVCRGLRWTLPSECAQGLLAANLIPFKKPRDPQGVRPIAVGETLRRLTAKVALAQAPKSRGLLPPLQCGVGVHDSVNSIVVATMRATQLMEQNPSLRLIQVDMKNAFNSLWRENILEYVSNFLPSLLPWAAWSLCNPSTLFWGQHSLPSTTGVQQYWWYLDDGNILAPADQVPRIFERLSVLFTRAGLTINAGKCQIFGMAGESVNLILNGISVPEHSGASSDDGVVLLGVPIGGVEFIKDRLTELVASAREYCNKLLELQDAQVVLTLLRLCGGTCRIVHLMSLHCSLPNNWRNSINW